MKSTTAYKQDIERLKIDSKGHTMYLKTFFWLLRKSQNSKINFFWRLLFHVHAKKHNNEIYSSTKIGAGLNIWHPFNITIAPSAVIGNNVTLVKGCFIGREYRGKRRGSPVIGNNVWVGANSTIVGHVVIGNNVLIASNSFVNVDVPSNSVVFGNPCIIKHNDNATSGYIIV